jgi:hypothetical protein
MGGSVMFYFKKYESPRHRKKNETNRFSRFKSQGYKGKGRGLNSFRYSIIKSTDTKINILYLKETNFQNCDTFIKERIERTIKNNDFPLRVITHSNVDKIISFKNVMNDYPSLKVMILDFNNPYCYTISRI